MVVIVVVLGRDDVQAEIVTALQVQSNIEPSLTCLVWQKLQEQNPHFFHVYDYFLRLKDHVTAFNYLVEQQALIQNDICLLYTSPSPRDRG